MALLQLALLGGIQVRLSAGRPIDLPSRSQALLAYLALQPGVSHPRDKLAALLWADAPAERARHSLRQVLLSIRQVFSRGDVPGLLDHGGSVAIDADAIDVDVHTFERLVREGSPESLGRAAAHYRGELLEGLSVQSPPFEEWLMTERERLRELAIEALAKLLAHHERSGAVEASVQAAIQLLGVDPAQEPVHRLLMRLYARQGRRGAALRQYQLCAASLQRELGVEPEPATKQLYQEILQNLPLHGASGATPIDGRVVSGPRLGLSPDALVADTPLVGRHSELTMLRDAWRESYAGHGRAVVLLGEAGTGKSRLIVALAEDAWRSDGAVLVGHAHESTQVVPFSPWLEAIRSGHVVEDGPTRDRLDAVWRAELARLFPELGPAPPMQGFENSPRLFEALARLFAHVAAQRPLLLVLEDLHWTDEASVRFLGFLARRLREWPILLVMTAREEDLPSSSLVARLMDALRREQSLASMTLPTLSREDTSELVRALARVGTDEPALIERVWTLSGGDPFTVVEMIRAHGAAPEAAAAMAVPSRVRALIAERLDRLAPLSRELVAVAAVVGRPIEFTLLSRAAAQDERTAAAAVEELVRRRVLVESQGRLEFAHERIRAVAEAMLLEPRRRALHAAVARALEEVHAGRLDRVADRLAFHHARSERPEEAVPHLSRLAETAARAYAHAEAAGALQEAIALLAQAGSADADRRIVEFVLRQSFSLSILGRFHEILDLLTRERARLERLDDPSLIGPYEFRLGMTSIYLGDLESAFAHGRRAIAVASGCGDDATVGKARYMLSLGSYYAGRLTEGADHARESIRLLEPAREQHWLGLAYHVLSLNLCALGEFELALDASFRTDAIGTAAEDPRLRCTGTWVIAWIHAMRGDAELGVEWSRKAVALAVDPVNRALATRGLGHAYLESGDPARAIPALEQAVEYLDRTTYRQTRGLVLAFLAEALHRDGHSLRARETAETALSAARAVDFPLAIGWAQRALGRMPDPVDGSAPSEQLLGDALLTFERIGAAFEAARTRLDLAETSAARGDRDAAADHVAAAHRAFAALAVPRYVERAATLAARLDLSVSTT